jgi:lambda family phage portal protein
VRRIRSESIQPNFLDRAIGFFDPERGARRLRARGMMAIAGGYLGGRRDRPGTTNWRLTNNSPDQDIIPDLPILRDRSRDLVRNAPLATGAVGTVVQNVVGSGLALQAKPDWESLGMTSDQASEWSAAVEREWLLFCESPECDLTRTQNFYGLQDLAFRSTLESGDVISLLPMLRRPRAVYDLKIQLIEADRLASPLGTREGMRDKRTGVMISGGVEVDANGAPVAYHILKAHPGDPNGLLAGADRVAAWGSKTGRRNVIHMFDRLRPGQRRGVPYLAPIIELLKQLDRYTEAEVSASVLSALITAFVKTEAGEGLSGMDPNATAADKKTEVALGTGGIVDLAPGEDISSFAPNRPNTAFDGFMLSVLRQVGTALGLPFEVLIKHFTASYSASRAAMIEAWRFFRGRREFLANQFCRPVYEAWMEEAVARGRISAPGFFDRAELRQAYLLSEWRGDAMSQIDPVKEVEAATKRIEAELSTREDETLQLTGKQWTDVHRQTVKENKLREKDGTAVMAPAAPGGGNAGSPPSTPPPNQNGSDLEDARI